MANRYWVGGTATWDATAGTKWSTTSGGSGGASVPTSIDNVFFDGSSTYTCTLGANAAGQQITFNNANASFTAGGYAVNCQKFITVSSSAINITNSTINCNGDGGPGVYWDARGIATFTSTGSTINVGSSSIRAGFESGGKTYNTVTTASSTTFEIGGGGTYTNLTFQQPSSGSGNGVYWTELKINQSITVTGTLSITGLNDSARIFVSPSNLLDTAKTITAATVSLTNVDFYKITAAGAASPFTGTKIGNAGGNTNITFPSSVTRYISNTPGNWSSTSTWSTTSGGSGGASVPLAHDDVIINTSGSTQNAGTSIRSLTSTNNVNFGASAQDTPLQICGGDITLSSGTGTWSTSQNSWNLLNESGSSKNISIPNTTGSYTVKNLNIVTGSYTLTGNIGSNSIAGAESVILYSTLSLGSNSVFCSTWNAQAASTVTAGTSTIFVSLQFSGGGKTYNTVDFYSTGSSFTVTGSNIINTIKSSVDQAKTINFTAGTTTTVNNWLITGSLGKVVTITSPTAAVHNLAYTGASQVSGIDYLNISYSNATPSVYPFTWFAGANSTNSGNNTGWVFLSYSFGNGLFFSGDF